MSLERFQAPYMTTAERVACTPVAMDILLDTDLNKLFIGDGATLGGVPADGWTELRTGISISASGAATPVVLPYDCPNTDYIPFCVAVDASGNPVEVYVENKTVSGFDATASDDCTMAYCLKVR